MHGQEQDVFLCGEVQQLSAKQRAMFKIETLPPLLPRQHHRFHLGLCGRQTLERKTGQRQSLWWANDLYWFTIYLLKSGAQDFMAGHDLTEGAFERMVIKLPAHAHTTAHVVNGIVRLKLAEDPETLLCKRERESVGVATTGHSCASTCFSLLLIQQQHQQVTLFWRKIGYLF